MFQYLGLAAEFVLKVQKQKIKPEKKLICVKFCLCSSSDYFKNCLVSRRQFLLETKDQFEILKFSVQKIVEKTVQS